MKLAVWRWMQSTPARPDIWDYRLVVQRLGQLSMAMHFNIILPSLVG